MNKIVTVAKLAELLADWECDSPYENGEEPTSPNWKWSQLKIFAQQDHHGDCTNEPFTCVRCFAEDVIKKARWIISQLEDLPPQPADAGDSENIPSHEVEIICKKCGAKGKVGVFDNLARCPTHR